MKPRVLVLYYSQTGQLQDILKSITSEMRSVELIFAPIKPVKNFPFPWDDYGFFNTMPETVLMEPIALQPLPEEVLSKSYDLILFGYQPWFLHPSLPASAFLQGKDAERLFRNTPVLTVIGARNMWLHAQERVKEKLKTLQAIHVGNIVLEDRHGNITSLMTIGRWTFKGQKESGKWLPEAGVSKVDIMNSNRFGPVVEDAIVHHNYHQLQDKLLQSGAVRLLPHLAIMEARGVRSFRKFATWIREKGGPDATERRPRVMLFRRLLKTLAYGLTPLSAGTAWMKGKLNARILAKEVEYFKSLKYEEGKF